MAKFLAFQWLCIKDALRGSLTLANAWSGLWGPAVVWLVSRVAGYPLTVPDGWDEALVTALAFLGATWLAVFIVRYIGAPARLYWEAHAQIPSPVVTLKLEVKRTLAVQSGLVDEHGAEVPEAETFYVHVSNQTERTMQECQLFLTIGHQDYQLSKSFPLRPGEGKSLPAIRVHPEYAKDRRAFIYLLNANCQIPPGAPALLLPPAAYVLKILSHDVAPVTALVRLSATTSLGSRDPRAWALEEIET